MKRIIGILLSAVLLSLTLTACSNNIIARNRSFDTDKISSGVVAANSKFAFNIFKVLNYEDPNKSIFISPISISTALTMTYNGADSSTKEIMSKVLEYKDIDRAEVNQSYNNLINYLENIDKRVDLNIANSIWIKNGEAVKEDFLAANKTYFNAEISTLDFSKDSAANTINKWISDATKGKIDKMIEPPIDSQVIMYLINAIYFKGEWSRQFDPKNTYNSTFKTYNGTVQNVRMMALKESVEYTSGDDYKAVRLPYGNNKTSMYCILPKEGTDINEFIEKMSIEKWNDIKKNMSETDEVMVQIPKFKLEYGIKNLNTSLQSLGMEEVFGSQADFSGIRDDIYISRVLHKAVIEVNEEGSEAAAATVVEMRETAMMEPITFIANRPFVFIIADDTTGTILFMGKLLSVQ